MKFKYWWHKIRGHNVKRLYYVHWERHLQLGFIRIETFTGKGHILKRGIVCRTCNKKYVQYHPSTKVKVESC